jgi:hypothetical protein
MLPFIYFIKDEVVDKVLKQPMTIIERTQSNKANIKLNAN